MDQIESGAGALHETGAVLVRFSQLPHAKSRRIYDANNGSALPGVLVRSEGQGATGDTDADLLDWAEFQVSFTGP